MWCIVFKILPDFKKLKKFKKKNLKKMVMVEMFGQFIYDVSV